MTTIEKDELDKFIEAWSQDNSEMLKDEHWWEWQKDYMFDLARKTAAFSAKRAREKAIEECKSALSPCFSVDVMMCFDKLKSL